MQKAVIGIGTRTGTDDQIGLRLVELLGARLAVSDWSFTLWEGADAATVAERLLELEGAVVLVDAADMGLPPGEYRCIEHKMLSCKLKNDSVSTHGLGLAVGIALAQELGFTQELKVFAVQPYDLSPGLCLTPEMSSRLPSLLCALDEAMTRAEEEWHGEG